MDVLVYLAGSPGVTLSREQILAHVWKEAFVTDDVLTRAISELRKACGQDSKQSGLVETVPKRGYRLTADVTLLGERQAARSSGFRPADAGALVVLAAVIAAVALWSRRQPPKPIDSIAVLELSHARGDASVDYLASGISRRIEQRLSSRTASIASPAASSWESKTTSFSATGIRCIS